MIRNGIDIVEIKRFNELKNNEKFIQNNFNISELKYIEKTKYNISSIAGLFAAKEAFLKAIKQGINISFKDIEIIHDASNCPSIILHNQLKKTYPNLENISLSISHDGDYAVAIVTLII